MGVVACASEQNAESAISNCLVWRYHMSRVRRKKKGFECGGLQEEEEEGVGEIYHHGPEPSEAAPLLRRFFSR